MNLSIVIPVFNERESLQELVEKILTHTEGFDRRIIFVDDGSTDGSYTELLRLRQKYPIIDVLKLRRNFGKSYALAVGFAEARGDVVITLDADLQDDPAEIPRLLAMLEEGYDIVCGWKRQRRDSWMRRRFSRWFNRVLQRQYGMRLHDMNSGFKAIRAEVIRAIPLYGEMHRFFVVHAFRLGFRVGELAVTHHPRKYGKSKYGWIRVFHGAADALAVWFLDRFQDKPLHFFGALAIILLVIATASGIAGLLAYGAGLHMFSALGLFSSLCFTLAAAVSISLGLVGELWVFQRYAPSVQIRLDNLVERRDIG